MIRLDRTYNVSEHIKKRSAAMTATILRYISDFERFVEVEVEPDEPEKGKVAHTVQFIRMRDETGSYIGARCFETQSLVNCIANQRKIFCSHVNAAVREIEAEANEGEEINE